MKTKKVIAVLLLMVVALSTNVMMAQQMPAIPVDEAVRIGKLDNGLTYYIRHNDYPEHRVNFYIAQRVGSIQEEDNQRGLAHFLEHMAFNGSEHFKGNGIIDYTRSLGVAFGRDLNAGTGFYQTVYNIDNVPSTRQSALDSCLLILKDWSHGLLLEDEEIDKERGVIHEEWRVRRTVSQRLNEAVLETVYPGSKYGQRMIIGLMDIVDNFPYQDLRDYYHKWYRPDNQALVIVGDVDVDYTEAKIQEMFKDIPAAAPDAPQVVGYPVPDNDEPIFAIAQDKEQTRSEVQILFKHDDVEDANKATVDYLIYSYMRNIATSMLSSRLAEKAEEPDCPFIFAYSFDRNYLFSNTKDALSLNAAPKEGQVEATVQALITEVLRAAKYGFTDTEYARAQESTLSAYENIYKERDKITNESLASDYCSNFLENEPMPSIEQLYQLMTMIVPNIPLENVNQVIPSFIGDLHKNLVIVNFNQEKDGAVYPTAQTLQEAVNAALNADIEAFEDDVKQEPLIANLPKKGKIVKESVNDKYGYKILELSNGARAVLMKTDFNENEIRMDAVRLGGNSLLNQDDYANIAVFNDILESSTLGGFTRTELRKALAGNHATAQLSMHKYTDEVTGSSNIKDLETMFQLTYLYFTDCGKDEKAFNQQMTFKESNLKNKDLNPLAAFMDSADYIMGNHNWRSKPFNMDDLKNVSYDRIMEIAKQITANAADYTFYFVGSFDEATIRPLIEQYIASLPAKIGKKSHWRDVEDYPIGVTECNISRKMETPMTYAAMTWLDTKTPFSLENSIKADILGKILDKIYTQKIREDAGATYSVQTFGYASYSAESYTTVAGVFCPIKPEFTDEMLEVLRNEVVEAGKHIDETSLNEIKELLIKDYNTNIKENWYWMWFLRRTLGDNVDTHTGYVDIVKAQTPETIAAFARQLLAAGNRAELVMTPAE